VVKPSHRKEMAQYAVSSKDVSISLVCQAFKISETCYRYQPKLQIENEIIANQLIEWRGKPKIIRSDNGPEFISHEYIKWAKKNNIQLEYIQPGNPQQNAYVERLNRTIKYSWVSQYLFESLEEVQEHATKWLWFYNHERPHKANDGFPPLAEVA
jgi:transposase InsO family protein